MPTPENGPQTDICYYYIHNLHRDIKNNPNNDNINSAIGLVRIRFKSTDWNSENASEIYALFEQLFSLPDGLITNEQLSEVYKNRIPTDISAWVDPRDIAAISLKRLLNKSDRFFQVVKENVGVEELARDLKKILILKESPTTLFCQLYFLERCKNNGINVPEEYLNFLKEQLVIVEEKYFTITNNIKVILSD
jgi:hypothetical protein